MSDFAKLFKFDDVGQVLVFKATHEETDDPSIVFMIDGNDIARPQMEGSYASEDDRDAAFDAVGEELALRKGREMTNMLTSLTEALQ